MDTNQLSSGFHACALQDKGKFELKEWDHFMFFYQSIWWSFIFIWCAKIFVHYLCWRQYFYTSDENADKQFYYDCLYNNWQYESGKFWNRVSWGFRIIGFLVVWSVLFRHISREEQTRVDLLNELRDTFCKKCNQPGAHCGWDKFQKNFVAAFSSIPLFMKTVADAKLTELTNQVKMNQLANESWWFFGYCKHHVWYAQILFGVWNFVIPFLPFKSEEQREQMRKIAESALTTSQGVGDMLQSLQDNAGQEADITKKRYLDSLETVKNNVVDLADMWKRKKLEQTTTAASAKPSAASLKPTSSVEDAEEKTQVAQVPTQGAEKRKCPHQKTRGKDAGNECGAIAYEEYGWRCKKHSVNPNPSTKRGAPNSQNSENKKTKSGPACYDEDINMTPAP